MKWRQRLNYWIPSIILWLSAFLIAGRGYQWLQAGYTIEGLLIEIVAILIVLVQSMLSLEVQLRRLNEERQKREPL